MMTLPPPSKRRYEKTRQGILDAARYILMNEGRDALSIRRLAEQVDYSPAAIYKYFSSKEEILEALRQEAWKTMAAHQADVVKPGTPLVDSYIQAGLSYVDFASHYPEYYLLLLNSSDGGPENLEEFKKDPNFVGLLEFIEAAVAEGGFQIPDGYTPFHLALLSWFTVHAVAMLKLTMMSKCAPEFEAASLEVMNMIKGLFIRK